MANELLSLSTLVERETVKIESSLFPDGKLYELRNADELSVVEYQTIVSREAQVSRAKADGNLSAAQARRLTETLDEIVRIVLPSVEAEVLAELTDGQKAAVANAWAAAATEAGGGGEGNAPRRRTGGGSSRGSSRSTAATRKAGSTSRSGS